MEVTTKPWVGFLEPHSRFSLSILYSAIKSNEVGSFEKTWMDLESLVQSKVSQKEKNEYHFLFNNFFPILTILRMNVLIYMCMYFSFLLFPHARST